MADIPILVALFFLLGAAMPDVSVENSISVSIAKKLVKIRYLFIPVNSKRESIYYEFVRPILARIFFKKIIFENKTPYVKSFSKYMPIPGDIKNILVVKCDHIGDFFLAIQAFLILRLGFPNAKLTLLCGSWNREVAVETGIFDEVLCLEVFHQVSRNRTEVFSLKSIELLNLPEYDISIDMRADLGTLFLQRHIRSKFKAGFDFPYYFPEYPGASSEAPSLDFALSIPSERICDNPNLARHAQALLASLASGIVHLFAAQEECRMALRALNDRKASCLLERRGKGPIIGLNPRSGAPTRDWPIENFVAMAKNLIRHQDATIVIFGTKNEEKDGVFIADAVDSPNVENLAGKVSLVDLVQVMSQLDVYVGHDSGGTHLAAVSGQKTICLHAGVTLLETFGPIGPNVTVLKSIDLQCSPCALSDLRQCKYAHQCMRMITPERVVDEIDKILCDAGQRGLAPVNGRV